MDLYNIWLSMVIGANPSNGGEIVKSEISEYDKDFPVYLNHAVAYLEKLALQDSVPEEKLVMWY